MKHQNFPWQSLLWLNAAVVLLRPLHGWSGRHYRRALLRRELRRISRGGGGAQRPGGARPAGSN